MKIVVRKSVFETNSSSNHSLIITNSKEVKDEIKRLKREVEEETGLIVQPGILDTKEDKVYMLGGFFDWVQGNDYNEYDELYDIFIKVLKDNNDEELINNLIIHREEHKDEEPYCTTFFGEGTLRGCYCYFDNIVEKNFLKFCYSNDEEFTKGVYSRLKDFIYGDGVFVLYDRG